MLIVATDLGAKCAIAIDTTETRDVQPVTGRIGECTVTMYNGYKFHLDIPYGQLEAIVLAQSDHDAHQERMRGYGDRPPRDVRD